LGFAYEECVQLTEYIRNKGGLICLFSLNQTRLSAQHAYVENEGVVKQYQMRNASFRKAYDDEINWSKIHTCSSPSTSYPQRFVSGSSPTSADWNRDEFLLKEYKMALEVVRNTIMHVYWGSLKISKLMDAVEFENMWREFFRATRSASLRYDSGKVTSTNDELDLVTLDLDLDSSMKLVKNGNVIERTAIYVASSLIEIFVHDKRDMDRDTFFGGYQRTYRALLKTLPLDEDINAVGRK
jgi:hypothetical protein